MAGITDFLNNIDLSGLSTVLGNTASGIASGRTNQANAQNAQDRNAISRYLAGLQGTQLNLQAPSIQARQAAQGDILSNVQDANIQTPANVPRATITGGLRPSLLGPNARAAGGQLSRQALLGLMNGPVTQAPPPLTPLPTGGSWDSIIGGGAAGAGILGSLVKGGGGSGSGAGGNLGDLIKGIGGLFGHGGNQTDTGNPDPNDHFDPSDPSTWQGAFNPNDWQGPPTSDQDLNAIPTDPNWWDLLAGGGGNGDAYSADSYGQNDGNPYNDGPEGFSAIGSDLEQWLRENMGGMGSPGLNFNG